jgi:hypothetical protein
MGLAARGSETPTPASPTTTPAGEGTPDGRAWAVVTGMRFLQSRPGVP